MAKFKVGDRARVVGEHILVGDKLVGKCCTVIAVGEFDGLLTKQTYQYDVDVDGYGTCYAHEHELEPLIDMGSWDEIEDSIGWNPTKEVEHD